MILGCNYWATYGACNMWRDWAPEEIERDFAALAQCGLKILRIFPNWRDFQPLEQLSACFNVPRELGINGQRLPKDPIGRAGMDPVMLERMETVLDLAQKYGLKCHVGIITGWMSGQMFFPPAFTGKKLITDPEVVQWQLAMVHVIVKRFKDHPAIAGWGPGNECNCLEEVPSRAAAAAWMRAVADAIRSEDQSHPISGGMHSLLPGSIGNNDPQAPSKWTIQDNANVFDMLTVHPYPFFTPHCLTSRTDEFKNCFHAASEMSMYAHIGGKPCKVEEYGTFSDMVMGGESKRGYIRATLYNTWRHGCQELCWWCGCTHTFRRLPPHSWSNCERELGMIDMERQPLPFTQEFVNFKECMDAMEGVTLPTAPADAVCVLTPEQDSWANALGAMLIAEQAGLRLHYAWSSDQISQSKLYFVPGIDGPNNMEQPDYEELIQRAQEGAQVVFTAATGILSPAVEFFGFRPKVREMREEVVTVKCQGHSFRALRKCHYIMDAGDSEVLATVDGEPVAFRRQCGKGAVVFIGLPLEYYAATDIDAINHPESFTAWKLYQQLAQGYVSAKPAVATMPKISLSYHPVDETTGYVVAVNNNITDWENPPVKLQPGWEFAKFIHGDNNRLAHHEALVAIIRRESAK